MSTDPVRTALARVALLRAVLSGLAIVAVLLPWNSRGCLSGTYEGYQRTWAVYFPLLSAGPLLIALVSLGVLQRMGRASTTRVGGLQSVGLWVLDIVWQALPMAAWWLVPEMTISSCGWQDPRLAELSPRIGQVLSQGSLAACAVLLLGVEPLLLFLALRRRSIVVARIAPAGA